MSGYPDDTIFNHGDVGAGARFIGKPFSTVELAARVRDILDEAPLT
jgi:DNA-binding response OmpR family regulator